MNALWTMLFLAAAAMTAGLVVVLRPLLQRYALARPNARSSHTIPTPQGGGIAIVLAVVLLALAATVSLQAAGLAQVLAATAFIAVIGAVDDIRAIPVAPRLALQTAAVLTVILALPHDLHIVPALPWWLERVLLVVGGVWFVNLVNFMDGLDWMTVAEVVPVSSALVVFGALGALPGEATLVALVLGGAMIGFAPFNRPVASLFLGDVGSLPIGLLLGWLLTLLAGSGHLAAALLLPLYYLADASITLVRRLLLHEPVWQAHRTHFYQRATDHGFTVPQIVGRVFAVNIALVLLALATVLWPSRPLDFIALVAGAGLVGLLLMQFARKRR